MKNDLLKLLLTKGYFPREIPPPFTSKLFGNHIFKQRQTLKSEWENMTWVSKNSFHNLARSGTLRRTLGIPNPISFYRISKCIASNWEYLSSHTYRSKLSLTTPIIGSIERAIDRKNSLKELPIKRAYLRSRSRYILQTDISRCYHSIYTHSIPWALHSKTTAKSNRNFSLLGNEIDTLIRNSQDGQTTGIPIGPDTSLLFAELVLTTIDEELCHRKISNGLRYIDDYDFGFQTLSDAECALAATQEILNDYSLALNPLKTEIIKLPWPTEKEIISKLKCFHFRDSKLGQNADLINFFDIAFLHSHNSPKDSALKFAISRLCGVDILNDNYPLFQNLLLQAAISEPGTLPFVLNQLLKYKNTTVAIDIDQIEEVMNSIILLHAPQGHGSEVAWALWTLLIFEVNLTLESANASSKMEDSIVAILLCDAHDQGLVPNKTDWSFLTSFLTADDLKGEMWLFAYEANYHGWFDSGGSSDHVNGNVLFRELKKNNVHFYDPSMQKTIEYAAPRGWVEEYE